MIRSSGVLLPIFSLPGPFGFGVFGEEALDFARKLKAAGVSRWLVLPFSPPGGFNSPYQCSSSFAGNPNFIDPRQLHARGLLTDEELEALYVPHSPRIDYASAVDRHRRALQQAFRRLSAGDHAEMNIFRERESEWLEDYCLFMTAKDLYQGLPWWEWPRLDLRHKEPQAIEDFAREHSYSILYYVFEQYEFSRQWSLLKDKINDEGVSVIGDLPIYPAADSADLWGSRHLFETNEAGYLSRVAGVPPDYFSENGQLWGNPLYRWDVMKENGYHYWVERVGKSLEWYDMVRIDHFRGFESYWAVPAGEKTAVNGTWEKGPAMDLFNEILRIYPGAAIIAEDLGDITNDVRQFLLATGLPGMKVLQFAFDPGFEAKDRPHSFDRNKVAFTGTHDNDTLLGWARAASDEQWDLICRYFGLEKDSRDLDGPQNVFCRRVIRTLWQSVADLVIVPLMDLLGLGGEYRINLPGTVGINWETRISHDQMESWDIAWLQSVNEVCQRS